MRQRLVLRVLLTVPALALAAVAPGALGAPASAAAPSTVRTLVRAGSASPTSAPTAPAGTLGRELGPDLEGQVAGGAGAGSRPVANRSGASRARKLRTAPLVGALASALPVGTAAATVGKVVTGLDLADQRTANNGNQFNVEPPDQALCVGGGHVVEAVNDVFRVYGTDGVPQTGVIDLNTFLGYPAAFNRTTGVTGPFVTDPVCLYDAPTSTFFLVTLTLATTPAGDFTGKNTLDVATATDPTKPWAVYHLAVQDDGTDGTPNHGSACPCIGDYPHIGADANGFYITTNEYPFFTDGFVGAQVYAFPKAALAAGVHDMAGLQLDTAGLDNGKPGFTVWPAVSPGTDFDASNAGTEWFLSSNAAEETGGNYHGTQVVAWALTGTSTLGSPQPKVELLHQAQGVADYYLPPLADQKAGPVPLADCLNLTACAKTLLGKPSRFKETESALDANDTRMQQVYWTGGRLYGSLDTAVALPGAVKAGIAYYVLQTAASGGVVSTGLESQGAFGVAGNNVTYPTFGVTATGKAILSYTLVGRDHYPSQAFSTLSASTPPTSVQVTAEGLGPQDGFSGYRAFGDPPRPRWGDYGASSVVDGTIWTANEYIGQSCTLAEYTAVPGPTRCGGTRTVLGNWSTVFSAVTPR